MRRSALATALALTACAALPSLAFAQAQGKNAQIAPRVLDGTCPPGSAAKGGRCEPTGIEPKGTNDYEMVWHVGDYIGGRAYHIIAEYPRYKLPPPPAGQYYVALGDQVLLIDRATLKVASVVGMVHEILG